MKKKIIMALLLLQGISSTAMADNIIATNDVKIRPGGTTELIVSLQSDADFEVYAYDFRLYLPEGIEVVKDGSYVYALSGRHAGHAANVQQTSDGAIQFGIASPETPLTGTSGPVIGIKLRADESLDTGETLQAAITTATYANKEARTVHPADITFGIETTDRVVLDEQALMVPDATSANVDILVRRSIKAGSWATLCLPFAMSTDKLKAAFGDDYQLAYISGCEFEKDGDRVTGIDVLFADRTAAAQVNRPYIIKVSRDITEFEVSNARINPSDGYRTEVTVEDDDTGEEVTVCSMTGNLKAATIVPARSLFLSNGQFWYSAGKTRMKAFRAYFTFGEVLASADELLAGGSGAAAVRMSVGGEGTTVIDEHVSLRSPSAAYYDLQGRCVANPARHGVYVSEGKKIYVK